MCGRVNVSDHEGLRALLAMMGLQVWPVAPPRFNVAPSAIMDAVIVTDDNRSARADKSEQDTFGLESMRWGFAAKGHNNSRQLLFNARSETVFSKPTFRSSAWNQRAIVPVNGFYEWQVSGKGSRRAFHIAGKDESALALAAIYQVHVQPEDKPVTGETARQYDDIEQLTLRFGDDEHHNDPPRKLRSKKRNIASEKHHAPVHNVCILTMAANQQMSAVHERMPVILESEQAKRWLMEGDDKLLASLCKQADHTVFTIREVNGVVNNAANDGPGCLESVSENHPPV